MSPTKLPTARKARPFSARRLLRNPLTSAAAISFSLTFVAGGIALLTGLLPARATTAMGEIDTGVVVLFVPLCALLLAIIVEVVRSIVRDGLRYQAPRKANALESWKPGMGEG
jgi:TRAP-type C4-dicarboxylate transport system permease small subunit